MYQRIIKNQIIQKFFSGKAVIIVGPRQSGKTTLSLEVVKEFEPNKRVRFFNGDNPTDRDLLNNRDLEFLKGLVAEADIIVIDEGQKIETIGQTVKLLVDYYKEIKQVLVTGSSSINLLEKTSETLAGRKHVFSLCPLSLEEHYPDRDQALMLRELESVLLFGSYPEIASKESFSDKIAILKDLHASSLYRDLLEFQEVKGSITINQLVKALALQIGSEVSSSELARTVGIDKKTVDRYLDLLEKSFVIFRLPPFTSNKRREIAKLKKVYFYDVGIRNTVISNFNPLRDRNDAGALWENFVVAERMKYRAYHSIYANQYFWRTYDGSEVDLVEEREGKLFGYECKWNAESKKRAPRSWIEIGNASFSVVTPHELKGFLW